ncbi:MAG: hypothetical protein ACK5MJ_07975 [Alphaproteobacteria bacterium]
MFSNGLSRFIGAVFWGLLWSLIWLYLIVMPLTLYIYLEGGILHKIELLLVYAIGLFISVAFLSSSIIRWPIYFIFLVLFGFLGITFTGAPFAINEKPICYARENYDIRPIGLPDYNLILNYDGQTGNAIFYWRKKPWPFYKRKELKPQNWPTGFVSDNSNLPAHITCLQNLIHLKDL